MKITDVQIRLITTETQTGKLKAVASITIDNAFAIHDIKLIEGRDGEVFMANPARKTPDGVFHDIAHPINQEVREQMQKLIMKAYAEELKASLRKGDNN